MDTTMFNYNPSATFSGVCIPNLYGCMDIQGYNYISAANTPSSCEYAGCTDSAAPNFDPSANRDNGQCAERFAGCTDSRFTNYEPAFNVYEEGSCSLGGCTDTTDLLYSSLATFDNGSCGTGRRRRLDHLATHVGCVDPTASNTDASATHDQSSCIYPVQGCMDSLASNYHSAATFEAVPSGCKYPVQGCNILENTLNYDSRAEVLSGCTFAIAACTNSGATPRSR
jgi:hypothetical protein